LNLAVFHEFEFWKPANSNVGRNVLALYLDEFDASFFLFEFGPRFVHDLAVSARLHIKKDRNRFFGGQDILDFLRALQFLHLCVLPKTNVGAK